VKGDRTLWRVFPWSPLAAEGERFSASFVPGGQGRGRFDLSGQPAGVLYLAETPEHAVAESLQRFRNQPVALDPDDLLFAGETLALVGVTLAGDVTGRIADLCDPAVLERHDIRPDDTAARNRTTTQRIAAELHAASDGYAGLRWWSSFFGEWHMLVLFRDRVAPTRVRYAEPTPFSLDHPAVIESCTSLDIPLR
jgi:hypothetical protein